MRQSMETSGCRSSIPAAFKAPEKFNQISEASQSETSNGPKTMVETHRMDGEFNIDLEEVGAASKANSDDESEIADQEKPSLEVEGQRGLIEMAPEHEDLPKSYPRLL